MKYPDNIYKVLLHLRDVIEGDRVTGVTDTAFQYLNREWTIEPAVHIDDIKFYCEVHYNGKDILRSDPAGQLLMTWEKMAVKNRTEYGYSQMCALLMCKTRSARTYRIPRKGDWKRIEEVRKNLTTEQKEQFKLMTPSEQRRFYENHEAFIIHEEN